MSKKKGYTKFGRKIEILNQKYNRRSTDLRILDIEANCVFEATYNDFVRKECISPYDKQFEGYGYLGEGEYTINNNKAEYKQYMKFLKSDLAKEEEANELLNFQNWCEFYSEHYYQINKEYMKLIKYNNVLLFLPSAWARIFNAKAEDYIKITELSRSDRYRISIPQLHSEDNKCVATLIDISFYEAEEVFYEELSKYKEYILTNYIDIIPSRIYEVLNNV